MQSPLVSTKTVIQVGHTSINIPKCELVWLKAQRDKIGTISKFQFGAIDHVESERIEK